MNELKEFLKALVIDPRAKELLKEMKEPENAEEAAEQYAVIAEKIGFNLPKENILKFLKVQEQLQQEKAAKAESDVKQALDEESLDAVAGGADTLPNSLCQESYRPGEWCWVTDSCSYMITYYDDDPNIKPDDTYECDESAKAINTADIVFDSGAWEEWGTECKGGWDN